LGSSINSEGKINEDIKRKIQNISKFYQIIKEIIWNRQIPKQSKTIIYKVHFKPTLTFNAETQTLTKRHKSTIHIMDMKLSRSTEGNRKQIELEIKSL
jgi:hypothetical protein